MTHFGAFSKTALPPPLSTPLFEVKRDFDSCVYGTVCPPRRGTRRPSALPMFLAASCEGKKLSNFQQISESSLLPVSLRFMEEGEPGPKDSHVEVILQRDEISHGGPRR